MTLTQFRRMKVFALRMVPTAIGGKRWQNELRNHVSEVLYRMGDECFDCYYPHVIDWDKSEFNPEGERRHRLYKTSLLTDFVQQYLWEENLEREVGNRVVESKLGCALQCCIRAACDVAVSPSAGVLGWTVGDLRVMWKNRRLPKWVINWFDGDISTSADDTPVWL